MAPMTNFAVEDPYTYLEGLGNYHSSEAFPGANPPVNNSPHKPSYGLRTERISGTSFTAPRHRTLQTWLYRTTSSMKHGAFEECEDQQGLEEPKHWTPNSYMWPSVDVAADQDWTAWRLLARSGDPARKEGLAMWLFSVTREMPPQSAYASLDGDCLIIPQADALDIQTELGKLIVRQNEIAVIPRGIQYRVTLPTGAARGYVVELFQGHFQLPELGVIGSTGLANQRDFQIPTAFYDGSLSPDGQVAVPNEAEWTITSRLNGSLWRCTQNHTPFDVAGWHGTLYPYKYDLARFCVLGNVLFDEHDPSLFTVLTAPSHRSEPGSAVADFALIPPRWVAIEDTWPLPYYHRNTMSEFLGGIVNAQDKEFPLTKGKEFKPFVGSLNGSMACHGPSEEEFEKARGVDTSKPMKMMNEGISLFLLETEMPLFVTDWAFEAAVKNFEAGGGGKHK